MMSFPCFERARLLNVILMFISLPDFDAGEEIVMTDFFVSCSSSNVLIFLIVSSLKTSSLAVCSSKSLSISVKRCSPVVVSECMELNDSVSKVHKYVLIFTYECVLESDVLSEGRILNVLFVPGVL